jgi:hypothetical protein
MRAAVSYLLESAECTMRRIVEARRCVADVTNISTTPSGGMLEAERRLNSELGKLEAVLKAIHMAFVLAQREQRTGAAGA